MYFSIMIVESEQKDRCIIADYPLPTNDEQIENWFSDYIIDALENNRLVFPITLFEMGLLILNGVVIEECLYSGL